MYQMKGKVALVTGAARGIGRAIALRLAEEGADLAAADIDEAGVRDTVETAKRLGVAAIAMEADVSRAEDNEAMVARTVAELKGIDIAVANAGIVEVVPLLEMAESNWDRLFAVNVKGAWLTAKAAARQMVSQGRGGRLILASSRAGKTPSRLHSTGAYATTKHAVVGLTRALAFELGPHRITVNAYCPGIVDTPMLEKIDRAVAKSRGVPPGTLRTESVAQVPLGRIEQPADVAKFVAWLASAEADYMTGQAVNIEGGTEVH